MPVRYAQVIQVGNYLRMIVARQRNLELGVGLPNYIDSPTHGLHRTLIHGYKRLSKPSLFRKACQYSAYASSPGFAITNCTRLVAWS